MVQCAVKMVLVDSIAALVRKEFASQQAPERNESLALQAQRLKWLAETFDIPVLVTNQIVTNFSHDQNGESSSLVPALGTTWAHHVNTRVLLSIANTVVNVGGDSGTKVRVMKLIKSPLSPPISLFYRIDARGVYQVDN